MALACSLGRCVAVTRPKFGSSRFANETRLPTSVVVSRITPRVIFSHSARFFSGAVNQNVRSIPKRNVLHAPLIARNYWWSSSSKSTPLPSSPIPPVQPEVPRGSSQRATSPEEALVPTAASPAGSVSSSSSASTTSATAQSPSSTSPSIEEAPPNSDAPDPSASETSLPDGLVSDVIPPPLQYGDLAELGLISWTPAGLVRWCLEILNVSTGIPWFWTIVIGTLVSRVLMFPLTVKATRNAALLQPFSAQLAAIKPEMDAARASGDVIALQRAALKQRAIYEKSGVSVGATLITPLVQVPVMMGLFFGIKKMCQLPVEQLKHSGLDILPDLTAADHTYGLSIIATAFVNMQVKMGMKDIDTVARPEMGHIMNGLRIFSIVCIPFMSHLPTGVIVSLISGMSAVLLQTYVLQQPAIRRALRIPLQENNPNKPKPPTMIETLYFVEKYARPWALAFIDNVSRVFGKKQTTEVNVKKRRKY